MLKPSKFGRVLLPFITPFKENEEVDYDTYAKLINYAIDNDMLDTVICTGTTGEFTTLTFDERVKLFETAVKAVNGRCPIIAGTGCGSTKETVALTKAAVAAGIKTCMVVGPYYCKPTQQGIYEHYMRVANETDADILIYNIPIFTGENIEPSTVARLVKDSDKFIGIKDESGINPVQILDFHYATKDIRPDFLIYNGDDIMLLPTVACGAMGVVSGGSMINGKEVKKFFELWEQGKNDECLEIFKKNFLLCRCFCGGRTHPNPKLRVAIELATGIKVGPARRPLDTPTAEEQAGIKDLLDQLGYLKK